MKAARGILEICKKVEGIFQDGDEYAVLVKLRRQSVRLLMAPGGGGRVLRAGPQKNTKGLFQGHTLF